MDTSGTFWILAFLFVHHTLAIFWQSFFLHRYAAHGQFTTLPMWEGLFFALTYLSLGSSYLSPRSYAILHRMHHEHADTNKDPHVPEPGNWIVGIMKTMLKTAFIFRAIERDESEVSYQGTTYAIPAVHDHRIPRRNWLDRLGSSLHSRVMWALAYTGFYVWVDVSFGFPNWMYLLLPIHWLMGPMHGVIINFFAHKIGYRHAKDHPDDSHNLPMVISIPMFGEGYHHNHHREQRRAHFAHRWYEVDLTYLLGIRPLDWLGIIRLRPDAR